MKTLKQSLLVVALTSLSAVSNAQITTPDPLLKNVFQTDNNLAAVTTSTSISASSRGVGYDGSGGSGLFNAFSGSTTIDTARTQYNGLAYRGNTIGAGSDFQFGIHAFALNRTGTGPLSIFLSIFNYDAAAGQGNVPKGTAVVENLEIKITASANTQSAKDAIYYTNKVLLPNELTFGKNYVLAFSSTPKGNTSAPASAVTIMYKPLASITNVSPELPGAATSTLSAADQATLQLHYNDRDNSGTEGLGVTQNTVNGPLAYRILAVPEPISIFTMAVGVVALLRRRKSN